MKRSRRALACTALLVGLAAPYAAPALAGPPQQAAPAAAVFALSGTPHLWIADEQGTLHWGGDTRALAGKAINWADRRQVSLAQLQTFRIGDPWLSAGLLKMGDPIYLVKWETSEASPTLLHIQSIRDVELRIEVAMRKQPDVLPETTRPAGAPHSWSDHVKLMFDLQVPALRADLTRVWRFLYGREATSMT